MVSMASKSRGMNVYAAEKFGPDSKQAKRGYALGDVVKTLIRTKLGQTIEVTHDCSLPRPYSRNIIAQGTKGIVQKYPTPAKIHIKGRVKGHKWEELDKYLDEFDHPLWNAMQEKIKKLKENKVGGIGHGGMDFLEDWRLIDCLQQGKSTDMDVYDAAAWSAVTALSEKSIAQKSRTIDFPDFTKGRWKKRPALPIIKG